MAKNKKIGWIVAVLVVVALFFADFGAQSFASYPVIKEQSIDGHVLRTGLPETFFVEERGGDKWFKLEHVETVTGWRVLGKVVADGSRESRAHSMTSCLDTDLSEYKRLSVTVKWKAYGGGPGDGTTQSVTTPVNSVSCKTNDDKCEVSSEELISITYDDLSDQYVATDGKNSKILSADDELCWTASAAYAVRGGSGLSITEVTFLDVSGEKFPEPVGVPEPEEEVSVGGGSSGEEVVGEDPVEDPVSDEGFGPLFAALGLFAVLILYFLFKK